MWKANIMKIILICEKIAVNNFRKTNICQGSDYAGLTQDS